MDGIEHRRCDRRLVQISGLQRPAERTAGFKQWAPGMSTTERRMQPMKTQSKILTVADLAAHAHRYRAAGLVVVQAHGTFDLLHLGHVRHLGAARALGDVLVVTITADRHVNKGPGRPIFTEALRAEMLAALHFVTFVAVCEASDAISAIEAIKPSIYAKGNDYQNPD